MNDKGFTEPESVGQPVIGDSGNLQEGSTLYLGDDSAAMAMAPPPPPPPVPGPHNLAPRQPPTYWDSAGVLRDSVTHQPVQQQGAPAPAQQPPAAQAPVEDKPRAHLVELPDKFIIRVDLPGTPRDSIQIDFDDPTLVITGHRPDPVTELRDEYGEELKEQKGPLYGEFKLTYRMTKNIDGVDATMEDGILIVEAKFKAKAKVTTISIK